MNVDAKAWGQGKSIRDACKTLKLTADSELNAGLLADILSVITFGGEVEIRLPHRDETSIYFFPVGDAGPAQG